VQGPGQALNQKENGVNVIVGQRKNSKTWDKAVRDGFVPGKTLFEIEEALEKGTIICYLLSDAAQIQLWPTVKKHLTTGKALYFSHGFGITYKEQTGIILLRMWTFSWSHQRLGTSLRRMFLQGRGLNSSYAIYQDATGRAFERVVALGLRSEVVICLKLTLRKKYFLISQVREGLSWCDTGNFCCTIRSAAFKRPLTF
jgi:ketol-acid reductoisomerase